MDLNKLTETLTPTGVNTEDSGKFIRVSFEQDVELWIELTEDGSQVVWADELNCLVPF